MTNSPAQISQSLVENMSYVVIGVDSEGVINLWNRAAELALGFAENEAVGQHANLVIPKDMQKIHSTCFTKALSFDKGFAIKEDVVLPFMHKSGKPIKIKGHAAIIRDESGLPNGSAVIGWIANK